MKYAALLSFLVLAGCNDVASGPHQPAGLAVHAGSDLLQNYKTDFSTPGTLVACNGETVTMAGTLHVMLKETDNKSGGYSVFTNIKEDLAGVGDVTGLKYEGSVTTDYRVEQNGATVVSVPTSMRLISQGKSPNFFYDSVLRITIDANGITRVDRESESTRCS